MSQLGGLGKVSVWVWRMWYEVIGVVQAKLMKQLVDVTEEVLVDGENGCLKVIWVNS